MEQLESVIHTIPDSQVPQGLKARILASIAEAREASYRLYRRLFGGLAILAAASFIPAVVLGVREISQSAFGSYLSLLAIDSTAAVTNWKVFLLSLVESAPIIGMTLSLAALFVFLASLKALAPYMKHNRSYTTRVA